MGADFFLSNIPVLKIKIPYKYRYVHKGYKGQLSHPICTEAPKKQRNYNEALGTSANRFLQSPPPSAAAGDCRRLQLPLTPGQKKPHRTMAFKRAGKDTRLQGRDEAHAERPSAGDAPRALLTMNQSSPSLTSVTGGSLSLIHPPNFGN